MRFAFERNIQSYNEVASDFAREELSSREEFNLNRELESKIARAVRSRNSTEQAQERIYALQERKQQIMSLLKERIALLDDPDFVPPVRAGEMPVMRR